MSDWREPTKAEHEAIRACSRAHVAEVTGIENPTGDDVVRFVMEHGTDAQRQALHDLAVVLTSGRTQEPADE